MAKKKKSVSKRRGKKTTPIKKRVLGYPAKRLINSKLGEYILEREDQTKNLRKLNTQFQREKRKTYADKLRREVKKLSAKLDGTRASVKDTRKALRLAGKLGEERTKLNRSLRRAVEKGDSAAIKKINNQLIHIQQKLENAAGNIGVDIPKVHAKKITEKEVDEIFSNTGFLLLEAGLTIWQAMAELNTAVRSNTYNFIIINGKRFSTKNKMNIIIESSRFWRVEKEAGGTPRYNIFTKDKPATFKIINAENDTN